MNHKVTILSGSGGWILYFGDDIKNFNVFRSDEPERLVEFLIESTLEINMDYLIQKRKEQIEAANRNI